MSFILIIKCMMIVMLVLAVNATADDPRKLRGKKHHRASPQQHVKKTRKKDHGHMPRGGPRHHPVFKKHGKENRSLPTHFTQTTHYHRANKAHEQEGAKKQHHEFTSRIVGGEDADEGEFKFMVSWDGSCGGSLIHDELVLTAAHCGGINGGVRIGSDFVNRGGVTRGVSRKVGHPNYNDFTTDYDYMILKLNAPVDISEYPPIQLNDDGSQPVINEPLTVIGYGALSEGGPSSDRLQKVQVPANSNQQCSNQYSGITESIHLCAGFQEGGKDSCQGDSGGPIFENRGGTQVQVGIVSFGDGCARPNRSGVYARVSGAYDWIQQQICNLATVNRPASCAPTPPTPPTAPVPFPAPVDMPFDSPVGSPISSPISPTAPGPAPVGMPFDSPINPPVSSPISFPTFFDDDFGGGYYDDDFDFGGGYYDDDYDFGGGYYDDDFFWWRR